MARPAITHSRQTWTRRAVKAAAAVIASVAVLLGGISPAYAAGPAQLSLEITPVHSGTGATITTAGFGQNGNKVAYRLSYSCSIATCTDTTVELPATQLDPTYGQFRLLEYETWTPPAGGGATITGDKATGMTVNLGDVPAGTSSTFLVVYSYPVEGGYTTAAASTYYPPGFQIQQSATVSSENATADVTAAAAPVTWEIPIPEPSIAKVGPVSVRPDTDVTYTLRMGSGCFVYGGSGRIIGNGSQLCAESFTVVDELPDQAVFVSASDGGDYDEDTHTVTWTGAGPNAAGGWGSSAASGWVGRGAYHARTVVVTYPAANFPEADGGADFIVPVTNDANVTMTYLDDAETVKTAAAAATHDVVRITPFGRATQGKDTTTDYYSGGSRYVDVPPIVDGMTCPENGLDPWARNCAPGQPLAAFSSDRSNYWYVDTYNRGNVPAQAVVLDDKLADSSARVYRVSATATTPAATIAYTITDGTTTTSGTASGTYNAPAGSWITAATVTSGSIPAVNVQPSDTGGTLFRVSYHYGLLPGAELGVWANAASATVSYPGYPEIDPIGLNSARNLTLRALPQVDVTPQFDATIVSATVAGGGQAVPGSAVTFTLRGATGGIPVDRPLSPQYVFIAPEGWEIQQGTAAFAPGSVPPGAAFVYRDVVIDGITREAVVASWPTGTTFGSNVLWPDLTVVASPTFAVPAGTSSAATLWVGDSLNGYDADDTDWGNRVIDAPDVDADGNTTEAFASAARNVAVSGSDRLDVIKEICVETADGCNWVSNPDVVVGVAPDAEGIAYRVSLRNGGNTTLSDVVGYDLLPFVGDSRKSTFGVALNEVTGVSDNMTLEYADSTNPCRPEVSSAPGCVSGWSADADGASAIRATVDGSLAPGAEASFTFTASVLPGAATDAIACNSVAVDTATTVPSEPRPVCATTQEADLAISVPDRLPLQAGRPGVVPFTVTNLGGSANAPAIVDIDVPEGIRITSLTPAGWSCEASETAPDGSVLGPVTLTCDAVTDSGTARSLALDAPDALNLPAVIPDDALVGEDTCFPAVVSGLMFDPNLSNNEASACFGVLPGDALISLSKDDARDEVRIGDELTYVIEVSNLLAGETLDSVTLTDALPENVAFVSASNGGQVTDQGEADADGNLPGGTVTWTFPTLSASGTPTSGGDTAEGADGSAQTVTVTVLVLQSAESTDEIVNEAAVAAADPANPDLQLTDDASDTDALLRTAAIQLVKSANPTTVSAAGDVVEYGFLVTNAGDVTLTDMAIAETAFTGTGDPIEVVCATGAASMAPGDAVTCSASYEVTQADLDAGVVSNTATAGATAPAGVEAPVSTPSTAVVSVDQAAALTLVKTAEPTTADAAGDEIGYEFVVTNTGNVTVANVAIVEGEFTGDADALSEIVCASDAPLAPTESVTCEATYPLTQADVDAGEVSNTATATAVAPGTDPVSEPSTAVVTVPEAAALDIEKSISGTTSADAAGDTVTYLFDVTNTGNVTVGSIAIAEQSFTGAGEPVSIVCPAEPLAPQGEMTCVGTYELVQADVDAGGVDNTAAATGVAPSGAAVQSGPSTAELDIAPGAAMTLVKSASSGVLAVDEEVTYSFVVTNTGNVTLADVVIDEQEFTGSVPLADIVCGPEASMLAPGEQALCQVPYVITQDDVDAGSVDNTAAAEATTPAGATVVSDPSSVQLPFDQEPAVQLVKSADSDGYSNVDEAIEYSFEVTNTGNVTVSDVSIIEQEFSGTGTLSDIECSSTTLLPGQIADCTAGYSVTQADIDAGELTNLAIASGVPAGADSAVLSDASSVTVPFVGATALALTKAGTGIDANGDDVITAGDSIRWTFTATNTGVSTLTDLQIVDPMVGDVSCEATLLTPGASVTCAASTYRITAADAQNGRVVNTATATALGAGGAAVTSAEATAMVDVEAAPGLAATGGQSVAGLFAAGLLVLLAGAGALWMTRIRRQARIDA